MIFFSKFLSVSGVFSYFVLILGDGKGQLAALISFSVQRWAPLCCDVLAALGDLRAGRTSGGAVFVCSCFSQPSRVPLGGGHFPKLQREYDLF